MTQFSNYGFSEGTGHTVRKKMKCSGDYEILQYTNKFVVQNELVHAFTIFV